MKDNNGGFVVEWADGTEDFCVRAICPFCGSYCSPTGGCPECSGGGLDYYYGTAEPWDPQVHGYSNASVRDWP